MTTCRFAFHLLLAAATALLPLPAADAACNAHSGARTTALVELYTSEGCSSCPPAERELARLREALDPDAAALALALHVGYWDYTGWKDPYAQAAFAERQGWLAHANRQPTLYTPEFFVGGAELGPRDGALRARVRRLNTKPAAAKIRLEAGIAADGALALVAEARAADEPAALYVALTESGLVSTVTRGENSGRRLEHDHVVRAWIGPVRLVDGRARLARAIALPAGWNRTQLELVAFVQDERSGTVLQALGARGCAH